MTAVGEAVEQGRNQTSVLIEDTGPVRELQVGGDCERTARVAMGEQDEQQLSLVGAQLDKAQLHIFERTVETHLEDSLN